MDTQKVAELIVAEYSPFNAVIGMEDYTPLYSGTHELRQTLFPYSTGSTADPLLVLACELHDVLPIEDAVAKIRTWWNGEIEIVIIYSLCKQDDIEHVEESHNVTITTMLEPGTFWD